MKKNNNPQYKIDMKKYRVYDCYGHNVAVFFEEKDASDYCNWKNSYKGWKYYTYEPAID